MESTVSSSQRTAPFWTTEKLSLPALRSSDSIALVNPQQSLVLVDLGRLNLSVHELLDWLRRTKQQGFTVETPRKIAIGDMQIDLAAKAVRSRAAEVVRLTPTEWRFLEQLVRRPGELVSPSTLLNALRGGPNYVDGSYLRVYMAQLRRKLEPEPRRPRYLMTEPGLGYRFQPSVSKAAPEQKPGTRFARGRTETCGRGCVGAERRRCRSWATR